MNDSSYKQMALRIFAYMMNRSSYFLFITYNQRLLKFVFRTAIYISMSIYTQSLLYFQFNIHTPLDTLYQ